MTEEIEPYWIEDENGKPKPCKTSVSEVASNDGVKPAACIWEYNSDKFGEDTWQTSCGNSFILLEGVPNDNKMKYCCYCGGALTEKQV